MDSLLNIHMACGCKGGREQNYQLQSRMGGQDERAQRQQRVPRPNPVQGMAWPDQPTTSGSTSERQEATRPSLTQYWPPHLHAGIDVVAHVAVHKPEACRCKGSASGAGLSKVSAHDHHVAVHESEACAGALAQAPASESASRHAPVVHRALCTVHRAPCTVTNPEATEIAWPAAMHAP